MGIEHDKIRLALRKRFLTVADLPPASLQSFVNRPFKTPDVGPSVLWTREAYLPATEVLAATNLIEAVGLVRYDVMAPKGSGTERADALAQRIREAFAPAQSLTDPIDVQLVRSEILTAGVFAEVWYFVPVQVNWRAFAPNN